MSVIAQCGNLNSLKENLTSFLRDIQDLQNGQMPRSMDLNGAPAIDEWSYGLIPARCIVGSVRGHLILGAGARVHTSQLVLIDPENGWARTWSRYYRLGASIEPAVHSESS